MIHFHFQTTADTAHSLSKRKGEVKIGETFNYVPSLEAIAASPASVVIFGIAEDIGVQANYGYPGAAKAWKAFMKAFANVQENDYNSGDRVLLLGYIEVNPHDEITSKTPRKELGDLVSRIDKMVAKLVQAIIEAGKFPIIIGGGHNNAYGNLKGSSLALKQAINALNIDAHTDLRHCDYRHSGNGFSYALEPEQAYLNKYSIYGLHKNYTPDYIFKRLNSQSEKLQYHLLEDMEEPEEQRKAFGEALTFVGETYFGLELDCDAITNFPASAKTPSGLPYSMVRSLIHEAAHIKNCCYFHLCEAAPKKKQLTEVGKALSYLVTDFIRVRYGH